MTMPSEITIRDTYNEFSENKRLSHRYIIIVHDEIICEFFHRNTDNIQKCFMKAAKALEKAIKLQKEGERLRKETPLPPDW